MEFQGVAQRIYSSFQTNGKREALPDVTYNEFASLIEQCRDYLRQFSRPKQCIAIWSRKSSKTYAFWIAAWLERRSVVFLSDKMGPAAVASIRASVTPVLEIQGDEELPFVDNPAENLSPPRKDISSSDIAYYIATSGSTGAPKIIVVPHSSLESWVVNSQPMWDVTPEDRVSQIFDLTFDPSISDMLWAFLAGACLVPLLPLDYIDIGSWVQKNRVSIWSSSPSQGKAFVLLSKPDRAMLTSLRRSTFIGELLTSQFVTEWKELMPSTQIENHYGPAECVISVSRAIIDESMLKERVLPIGSPYPGILFLQSPEGDLLIQSNQVANGYLNLNSDSFQITSEKRSYNSGDQAEQLNSGDWKISGRLDSQIKINGQRWESEGIEALFEKNLSIPVLIQKWTDENMEGIDLVLLGSKKSNLSIEIEAAFKNDLPSSLRPRNIWLRDSVPLNTSGKKDRVLIKQELTDGKLRRHD